MLTILYKYNLEQNLYRILLTQFSILSHEFILKKYDTIPSKWRSIPAVLINSPSSQNDLLFNEKMLNQHLTQAKTTYSTQITRNTNKSSWKIIGERDTPLTTHITHPPQTTNSWVCNIASKGTFSCQRKINTNFLFNYKITRKKFVFFKRPKYHCL